MILNHQSIIRKLLIFSDDNSELSLVNREVIELSHDKEVKVSWLLRRPHLLESWLNNYKNSDLSSGSPSYSEWLTRLIYGDVCQPVRVHCLLDEAVGIKLLDYAFRKQTSWVPTLLNVLAARGSLQGVACALQHPEILTLFETNTTLLTNSIYACVQPFSRGLDAEKSLALLKFFSKFNPTISSIDNALEMACRSSRIEHVKILMKLNYHEDHAVALLASARLNGMGLLQAAIESLVSENVQNYWKILKGLLEKSSKGNLAEAMQELQDTQKKFVQEGRMELFQEYWSALLDQFIHDENQNGIKELVKIQNESSTSNLVLMASLNQFAMAIDTDIDDLCDLLVPLIDTAEHSSKKVQKERLQTLLSEFCKIHQNVLYSRLCPIPLIGSIPAIQREFVTQHQISVIKYLIRAIRKIDPSYLIKPSDIWSSIQAANIMVTDSLRALGGNVNWLDLSKEAINKKLQPEEISDDFRVAEDSMMGVFQAYGGYTLKVVRTRSGRSSDSASPILGSEVPRHGNVGKIHSSNLGKRRASNRPNNAAVLSPGRITNMAKFDPDTESNQIWNVYFKANAEEVKVLLQRKVSVDWMELSNHSPSSVSFAKYDIIVEDEEEVIRALHKGLF